MTTRNTTKSQRPRRSLLACWTLKLNKVGYLIKIPAVCFGNLKALKTWNKKNIAASQANDRHASGNASQILQDMPAEVSGAITRRTVEMGNKQGDTWAKHSNDIIVGCK